ncbi:hypothetical protein [Alkalitalea saponilacus]|uniref:Uncharacterized protein n=1 Tax=Alkalitalea saponilacus TaxID=889453 RepID=A0A1T5HML4_9BACT|nr:hypothetical protein [Alkalitalea saponilacus]ASB49390.1 hypothetical protein CDL62_09675 [Alkalitalea saponilacus]SKC21913.1 hypothetical protein SAMN03080601_02472 [Alkalitalea saponilacus]
MKQFIIYGSKRPALGFLGRVNQILFISLVLLLGFIMLFSVAIGILELPFKLIVYPLSMWLVLLLLSTGFNFYLKKVMIPIGILEIEEKTMKKSIGDYSRIFRYSDIEKISTKSHLKGWLFLDSNKTIIVTISTKAKENISFVIKNNSENQPQITFEEIIKSIRTTK